MSIIKVFHQALLYVTECIEYAKSSYIINMPWYLPSFGMSQNSGDHHIPICSINPLEWPYLQVCSFLLAIQYRSSCTCELQDLLLCFLQEPQDIMENC